LRGEFGGHYKAKAGEKANIVRGKAQHQKGKRLRGRLAVMQSNAKKEEKSVT